MTSYIPSPSHRAVLMVRWLKAVLMHHTSYLASVSARYTSVTSCQNGWYEATRLQIVDTCLFDLFVTPSVLPCWSGSKQCVCNSPITSIWTRTSILLCIWQLVDIYILSVLICSLTYSRNDPNDSENKAKAIWSHMLYKFFDNLQGVSWIKGRSTQMTWHLNAVSMLITCTGAAKRETTQGMHTQAHNRCAQHYSYCLMI